MSYAEARSKLANLLIKAGYDKAKSLRAVKYPYIDAIQLTHDESNIFFISHRFYEDSNKNFVEVNNKSGFVLLEDDEYKILGKKNKAKSFIEVTQERIDFLAQYNIQYTAWFSSPLTVMVKYQYEYPKKIIEDSFALIGDYKFGVTDVAGFFAHQEGVLPLPQGGWLEVELNGES